MADHRASWNEVYSEHNRITVNTVSSCCPYYRETDRMYRILFTYSSDCTGELAVMVVTCSLISVHIILTKNLFLFLGLFLQKKKTLEVNALFVQQCINYVSLFSSFFKQYLLTPSTYCSE